MQLKLHPKRCPSGLFESKCYILLESNVFQFYETQQSQIPCDDSNIINNCYNKSREVVCGAVAGRGGGAQFGHENLST